MLISFTRHAREDRLNARLLSLVTEDETIKAVKESESVISACAEYAYITIKKFSHRIYIKEETNGIVTDETPKGDLIIAKVKKVSDNQALIITVMLRKSTSQSTRYLNH